MNLSLMPMILLLAIRAAFLFPDMIGMLRDQLSVGLIVGSFRRVWLRGDFAFLWFGGLFHIALILDAAVNFAREPQP